jgi:hypothetical protein
MATDNTKAAVFFRQCGANRPAKRLAQQLPVSLAAFGATCVRRDDNQIIVLQQGKEGLYEEHVGFQVFSPTAERILKCGKVVNIQRHDRIGRRRQFLAAP